jgi:hypothetical protein
MYIGLSKTVIIQSGRYGAVVTMSAYQSRGREFDPALLTTSVNKIQQNTQWYQWYRQHLTEQKKTKRYIKQNNKDQQTRTDNRRTNEKRNTGTVHDKQQGLPGQQNNRQPTHWPTEQKIVNIKYNKTHTKKCNGTANKLNGNTNIKF